MYVYNHRSENVDSYVSMWFLRFLIPSNRHVYTNIILGGIVRCVGEYSPLTTL